MWTAVIGEITGDPRRYVAEAVQSLLLIAVVVWYGRRVVRKRLPSRRSRIEADLAGAAAAERETARLRDEAKALTAGIEGADSILEQTVIDDAERERDAALARAETEALALITEALRTVEAEENRIRREAVDRLLNLTTETSRRYLDEMLSEDERRALTRQAIHASLAELEAAAGPAPGEAG